MQNFQPPLPDRLLRLPQVLDLTGVKKSTWWAWCRSGHAPQGLKLGPGVTCWRESEIQAFINSAPRKAA